MADSMLADSVISRSRFAVDDFQTEGGCRRVFGQLADMSDEELGKEDIGLVNLLCAVGLPSADPLNIPQQLGQLDQLAEYTNSGH